MPTNFTFRHTDSLSGQLNSCEKKEISKVLSLVRGRATQTFIAICANARSTVVDDDYDSFSVSTEYFSNIELSAMIQGLQNRSILAVLFSEPEMISFIVNGAFNRVDKQYKLVYSTRGSGTGRSRSCMIPALCESYKIRICSPDSYSVSLAANKFHVFRLLRAQGLPTPDCWLFQEDGEWLNHRRPMHGQKVIVKPCYESASIGVDETSIITYSGSHDYQIKERCAAFRQPMVVQAFVPGYEVEVPVARFCRTIAMPPVGVEIEGNYEIGDQILDYGRVYLDAYGFYLFDNINHQLSVKLKRLACMAVDSLMLRGLCRIDFRTTSDGSPFITDVNVLPHLTTHSSCTRAMEALGFEYEDLLCFAVGCGMGV